MKILNTKSNKKSIYEFILDGACRFVRKSGTAPDTVFITDPHYSQLIDELHSLSNNKKISNVTIYGPHGPIKCLRDCGELSSGEILLTSRVNDGLLIYRHRMKRRDSPIGRSKVEGLSPSCGKGRYR